MRHTIWMEDVAVVLATICELEVLRFAFGWQVATAVAVTQLIACVGFLFYAGRRSA